MEILIKIIDVLTSNFLKETFTFWSEEKIQKYKNLILKELNGSNFDSLQEDELFSIFYQLFTAIQLGVAENNLILMVRVIKGMLLKNKLTAPSFLRYSRILGDLNNEEIKILITVAKHCKMQKESARKHHDDPVQAVMENLSRKNYERHELRKEQERLQSIAFGLLRTGFFNINPKIRIYNSNINSVSLDISALFKKFLEYCPDFDDLV